LDLTAKSNEALEVGMRNLVRKLLINMPEQLVQNDASKQLGTQQGYDDLQSQSMYLYARPCN
jgi:hypothetical protein